MKIVIAPDSFKGSMDATQVTKHMAIGVLKAIPHAKIVELPIADGGEGTVQALVSATNGAFKQSVVVAPLGNTVTATWGILGDKNTAVIEMAAASGLPLVDATNRSPMKTTTFGTGQLIKDALDCGCRKIMIGLGGSATNDGGAGALSALGVKFLNGQGNQIPFGCEGLRELSSIDISTLDPRLKDCEIIAACDVDNPLCGIRGATYVFAPQKGGETSQLQTMDDYLLHYGQIVERTLNIHTMEQEGAGAAGGFGFGLVSFLNGRLEKGIDIVLETVNLAHEVKDADLVITGEGMMDFQTAFGKAPFGVAKVAGLSNVPVVAICGSLGQDFEILFDKGFTSIFSIINRPMTLEEAMGQCGELLEKCTENVMRILKLNKM